MSSLMYYTNLSKEDIMHSSRAYLYELYAKSAYRAADNLGVDPDANPENDSALRKTKLTADDYPNDIPKIGNITEEALAKTEDPKLDIEFLSQFDNFDQNRYFIDPK